MSRPGFPVTTPRPVMRPQRIRPVRNRAGTGLVRVVVGVSVDADPRLEWGRPRLESRDETVSATGDGDRSVGARALEGSHLLRENLATSGHQELTMAAPCGKTDADLGPAAIDDRSSPTAVLTRSSTATRGRGESRRNVGHPHRHENP